MPVRALIASFVMCLTACAAELGGSEEKEREYADQLESAREPLSVTERRYMYFEGSCHFLACCSKRNCSLPDSSVVGACGTGCTNATPWIARPDRDRRYACGECVRVCREDTGACVDATVWDNSITESGIEGNIALFDALGLSYTESSRSCSGSGGAWVTVGPCTASDPTPPGDGGTSPPEPEPEPAGCACGDACGYCWCDTDREESCPDSWRGTRDGCDCGCQWSDPDCGGSTGGSTTGGSFAGVYCTSPGLGCGGNTPCWPATDCPSGSSCDWSNGSWGRCMD